LSNCLGQVVKSEANSNEEASIVAAPVATLEGNWSMRGLRFGLLLAGTAVAVILAARTSTHAGQAEDRAVEALVPVPDTSGFPPPTAADAAISAVKPTARPEALVPVPDTSGFPPPSAKDVDITSTTPASPAAASEQDTAKAASIPATPEQQLADKLREYLTGKVDRIIDRKSRPAVDAFYAARNYAPLWIDNGNASARAKAAAAFLAKVDADGLDPADYPVPQIKAGADIATLADAELKFTSTVLTYARHAQTGRVHYSRISPDIFYNLVMPEPADLLGKMADAKDVAAALDSFNPPHAGYKALKAKLAEMRPEEASGKRIEHGPVLKLGKNLMEDPRVPLLRERLGIAGQADDTSYDKTLADAVKKFQRQHGMAESGVLTAATIDALNGVRRDREADIIRANMERWRWLPRDLGKAYVMVNIPDFTLKVVDNGAVVWTTRIVSGKPGKMATPLLSETMKYITINPTWNVPPSIINNEYLPVLQQDPGALERVGLKVEYNRDGTIRIYQPPGERNALGRIRFNFPNKFLVYQHDTPDKHLFAQNVRAFSHGCMRVQNPDKYAEVLFSIANPKDGYTVDRIHKMYGTGERDIQLQTHIPVHLTYQTAFVDDAGKLVIRDDIYGRDASYFAVMRGSEHRVADLAVEHREANATPRPRLPTGEYSSFASNGGSFFERLFGGSGEMRSPPPPRAVPQRRVYFQR
jgi:murein L,D-transpeptidase YcbB/YkuD